MMKNSMIVDDDDDDDGLIANDFVPLSCLAAEVQV